MIVWRRKWPAGLRCKNAKRRSFLAFCVEVGSYPYEANVYPIKDQLGWGKPRGGHGLEDGASAIGQHGYRLAQTDRGGKGIGESAPRGRRFND
jgi:hypothetical protein